MAPIISAADLGGDYEPKAVPEGVYDLRIISAKYAVSEKGNAGINLGLRIEGETDAPLVNEWVGIPDGPGHEYYKPWMRKLQAVLAMFGWGTKDFDPEQDAQQLVGQTASKVMLTQAEDDRDNSMRNRIKYPRGGGR